MLSKFTNVKDLNLGVGLRIADFFRRLKLFAIVKFFFIFL